jgi:hypothetical protein
VDDPLRGNQDPLAHVLRAGGLNTILGAIYALVAALGVLTMAAEAARISIAERLLGPLLGVAFAVVGFALVVGLPVAASQL